MTISTDELRKMLADATPGPWRPGRGPFFRGESDRLTCRVYTECPATEMESYGTLCVENARLIAAVPDLAAEVIRLRKALEPFAKVAEHDIGYDEADTDVFRPMKLFNRAPRIRVGDLRRARAALNHKETE